jgi:3-oxoacyl-[acyl-carrier-protein] synthase-3
MIHGMGVGLPRRAVSTSELARRFGESEQALLKRTGIEQRRVACDGENSLTLAVEASRSALASAGLSAGDLDMIILATCTPLVPLPSTACFLQRELGCRSIPAFDLSAVCSGFVYAFVTAAHLSLSGSYRHLLVVGSETMSTITDPSDRATSILFGDGAGAVVLGPADNGASGVYRHVLGSDGAGAELIWIPAGGSMKPASAESVGQNLHFLRMRGREVFRFAVDRMHQAILDVVARGAIDMDDVSLIVPHQANLRIIEAVAGRLGLPKERFALNIDRYGNTSAASIPIALEEAWREGRVERGDAIVLVGLGAGMTWGAALMRL